MTTYITKKQIFLIAKTIEHHLIDVGVSCVALIDVSGNIVVQKNKAHLKGDIDSMAVLAAGNFSAVCAIADRIGEGDFSLLVHKGKKGNIYINKVFDDYLLMTISGRVPSVGVLRLKVDDTISQIQDICHGIEKQPKKAVSSDEAYPPGFSLSNLKKYLDRRIFSALRKKVTYRVHEYTEK